MTRARSRTSTILTENHAGFTLIELTVASILLVVGVTGFMGAILASQVMVRSTAENNRAATALVSTMEEIHRAAAADFQKAVEDFTGTTVYERKVDGGTGGDVTKTDVATRTTTSVPSLDNTAEADAIRAKSDEAALAAPLGETAPVAGFDGLTPKKLQSELAKAVRDGHMTPDQALATWLVNGDGTAFLLGADGGTSTVNVGTDAHGLTTTETHTSDADGTETTTKTTGLEDGTKINNQWVKTRVGNKVVKQRVSPDGEAVTEVVSTAVVTEDSTTRIGVVDFDILETVGDDAKTSVAVLVDETAMDPPVDLNGDGDYVDTNVSVEDMTAMIVHVVVEWTSGGESRKVEGTTVIARGEVEER